MQASKTTFVLAGFLLSISLAPSRAFSQGADPLTLPLFQNNNSSCQDQNTVDESYTATCGTFTGENPDFPDCVATTELRPEASSSPRTEPLLSYFQNQNLHDDTSCGGQFAAGVQSDLTYQQSVNTRYLGSVVNADFSGSPFNDIVYPVTIADGDLPSVLEGVQGQAGGGFAAALDVGVLPALEIGLTVAGEDPLNDFSTFRTDFWPRDANFTFGDACDPVFGGASTSVCAADKSVVAVDCNGDGAPDSVTAIVRGNPTLAEPSFINLRTNVNGGSGLAAPPLDAPAFPLPDFDTLDDDLVAAAVASGDFGGAGDDVVVAIFSTADPFSQVVVCQNDGACGYTCLAPQSLETLTGEDFSRPFSVAAGDFNGDGADDAVVSLAGQDGGGALLSNLLYLFGDGAGSLANPLTVSTVLDGSGNPLLQVGGASFTDMVPTSLSTGQFDNDGVVDVAVTNFHGPVAQPSAGPTPFNQPLPQGDVVIFTSNGTSGGGFSPLPTALQFPTQEPFSGQGLPLGTFSADRASGLAVADLDRCGGDDVVALAELCLAFPVTGTGTIGGNPIIDTTTGNCQTLVQRIASIFLNANEAPIVDAGPDLEAETNQALAIAATCQDPTDDDRTFTWTVTASPPGSTPQLTPGAGALIAPQNEAATSFQSNLPGTYTLELNCADFCGLEASDTLTVTIQDAQLFTQGGCLANLTPSVMSPWSGLWYFLGLGPLLYRRLRRIL